MCISNNNVSALNLELICGALNGQVKLSDLSEEEKGCIKGCIQDEIVEIHLDGKKIYKAGKNPFVIGRPCKIYGNGTTILGEQQIGFVVMSSSVEINDIIFDNFSLALDINDHFAKGIENVSINRCTFKRGAFSSLFVASDVSNGHIKGVTVSECNFEGAESGFVDDYGGSCMLVLAAGQLGKDPCNNCLLEKVKINKCKFTNDFRMGVQFCACAPSGWDYANIAPSDHNTIDNVEINDCYFNRGFDATINVISGCCGTTNSEVKNITIQGCKIVQGIWSVYFTGVEPVVGHTHGGTCHDLKVINNEFEEIEGGCGEHTFGVVVQSGRIDYDNKTEAVDGNVYNLYIAGNKFKNIERPVFLTGANILNDSPENIVSNCGCYGVVVENNEFKDCDDVFTIYGSHHEGRRVDWNIGLPPHEKNWGPLYDDPTIIAGKTNGCFVKDVTIKNNRINGYRFKYKISGVWGWGQGEAKNDYVENVVFENNHFEHGEGHISLKDAALDDRVHDGGGNYIKNIKE